MENIDKVIIKNQSINGIEYVNIEWIYAQPFENGNHFILFSCSIRFWLNVDVDVLRLISIEMDMLGNQQRIQLTELISEATVLSHHCSRFEKINK